MHQRVRAATISQAIGRLCVRCGRVLLEGQAVQLDHADDGSGEYLGYSHRSCNASAGASRGNAMRAAAYRASKGLPSVRNGPVATTTRPPELPKCQRTSEEIMAAGKPLPCVCNKLAVGRCW
jgi:hypothetical protein